jgi:CreA protein
MFSSNDTIVIEAFDDPNIDNISCFLSRAKTGGISGAVGVAEDTADAAISCVKTGNVTLPDSVKSGSDNGEKVLKKSTSVLFKSMQVIRTYDVDRGVLTYMVYSDKLIEGSPKNSISAVFVGK